MWGLVWLIGAMDSALPATVLLFAGALLVKHVICDGPLQTLGMVQAKSHYGRPLGLLHALIHMAGTLVVCLLAGVRPMLAVVLAAADGIIHYHVDFTKESTVKAMKWTVKDGPFWWALTLDQALHQATYLTLAYFAYTR
jgi:hypothetical protein